MSVIKEAREGFSLLGEKVAGRAKRFWREATSPLRRLPDVVIIGAQKGGTTSLYRYLCQHPDVYGADTKEVHYFDNNYNRNPLWYRSKFDFYGDGIAIEATPKYLFDEPSLWRMSVLLPDVKVIAVLREPVARAYSHYMHVRRGMGRWGTDHRSFEEAVRADIRFARERRILGRNEYFDIYHSYVRRGMYAPQVKRYLDVYGDDLIVLKSEELFQNTNKVVNSIFAEIGLRSYKVKDSAYKEGKYDKEIPIREELEKFFAPVNDKLYEIIGVSDWWKY